jgi:hypothetical protein
MAASWTRPADVREAVYRKWPSLLTAFAAGQEWAPLQVPVRGPRPAEIGERLREVQQWAAEWERADRGPLRVEHKQVGGRHIGSNMIPCRAWIDGYEQAWTLLEVRAEVRAFTDLAELTKAECPRLVPWLVSRPLRVLSLAPQWAHLLATVRWIDERQVPGIYLRQVDIPGVDTKFIDRHKAVLAELLDLQLDPARIDQAATVFEGRFGFARKPGYVRFRIAAGAAGYSELTVRADEFTAPPVVSRVYVVENEITYLAFPLPADAMVIFGGGYAVPVIESLSWLADLDVTYWGDIDTHGFAILSRLRAVVPHVRSMLMDEATLLAHRSQWVGEPSQATTGLDLLSPAEQHLCGALLAGVHGPAIRLEQERVSFAAVEWALSASR